MDEQTVVIERLNFTTKHPFVVQDGTRSFPFDGPGTVDSILIVTEEDDYSITVDQDTPGGLVGENESAFLDDEAFTDLEELSVEFGSVTAFENNEGNHVLEIGPVDFVDTIRAIVEPNSSITVLRQRAQVTLG